MNGSAGGAAGGEDEGLPAQHELGEELKFTGRYVWITVFLLVLIQGPLSDISSSPTVLVWYTRSV